MNNKYLSEQILLLHQLSRSSKKSFCSESKGVTTYFRDGELVENFGIFISFYSARLSGGIISTFMHRRHLMVWNVFAPRLLFEVVEFLTVILFCFIIMLSNVCLHSVEIV